MCDSIELLVWLPEMDSEQYERCQFPSGTPDDSATSDFRTSYPSSPLTEAGYKITPLGQTLPGYNENKWSEKNRRLFGRIAGYMIGLNPPACSVGHNRLLVNGVPASVRLGVILLKYWLLKSGSNREGLDAIDASETVISSVTPTFLFIHSSEADARSTLAALRERSEALLNKRDGKRQAYSCPPKPFSNPDEYIYTSYIRTREFLIDAYVKVPDAKGAFCKALTNTNAEWRIQDLARRTLRIGIKLHAKWLREHDLDRSENWLTSSEPLNDLDDPYRKVFLLAREKLSLDRKFRTAQFRSTSIHALNLNRLDAQMVQWHVKGNIVREHEHFSAMPSTKRSKSYSACRLRVLERAKIDFDIPFGVQKSALSEILSDTLTYSGEFTLDELDDFIFSRRTVPKLVDELENMIETLTNGNSSIEAA